MRTAYALIGVCWVIIVGAVALAIGHNSSVSRDTRAITSSTTAPMALSPLALRSTAFADGQSIPPKFTCDGDQVNPRLEISGVPAGATSLALIMDDPDVPKQLKPDGIFDHWILFNIPPSTREIAEGATVGVSGANGAGNNAYTGPCPPPQYEPSEHRYFFKLYALDTMLDIQAGASKADLERAMQGHVVAQAQLIGTYKRR